MLLYSRDGHFWRTCIPSAERTEWLTAVSNDAGYHELTYDEIVAFARADGNGDEEEDDIPPAISYGQECSGNAEQSLLKTAMKTATN